MKTFHELEFAHDHRLPLFPIRLCEQWPPAPQNNERGIYQNKLVFKNGLVYIDDRQMNKAQHVADQIAESVARMGIFRTKLQLLKIAGACFGKSMRSIGACSGRNVVNVFGRQLYSKKHLKVSRCLQVNQYGRPAISKFLRNKSLLNP